jgi:hypothetical protein
VAGRIVKSNQYLSGAAALLFGLSCSFSHASNGVKSDSDEISEPPVASASPASRLVLRMIDHGLTDSEADMKDPAADPASEKVESPALADASDAELHEQEESALNESSSKVTADMLPETALRLPGVSDTDLPRFRRQMYRTDI